MICKLSDIVKTANTGADAIKKAPILNEPTNLRCLRIGDVSQKRDFSMWGYTKTSKMDYERYKLHKGDSIIARTGNTIGVCTYIEDDIESVYNNGLIRLTAKKELARERFLFYLIRSTACQDYIQSIAYGTSTQPNMKIKDFLNFDIIVPTLEIQDKIIAIVDKIEKKIQVNTEINNNLLEQLNQLYTEFSTRSDWSEMTIGDVAVKVAMGPFGSNIKVSTFVEYGVPIISGNHLRGYFLEEPSYNYITKEHAEKLKNSIVYPKDIIFTHAGNIGQVAMIPDGCEFPYYVLSQRQFYLRCNTKLVVPEYMLLFFHSKKGQHELLSYANQTGVPSIAQPATNLKKIRLPIPSLDEQKDWLSVVTPLITMYQNNYQETKRLASLRDTLLPKLMSGGIDVSNLNL